jgi:hypothetical protein
MFELEPMTSIYSILQKILPLCALKTMSLNEYHF